MWERVERSLKSAGVAALVVAASCLTAPASAQSAEDSFMPHGFCYLWNPKVIWLNVISDGLIALSYYCIPLILIYFIRKNRELPFSRIFWMFGVFILACGTTHLLEIWNVWHGSYLLAGAVKALTAAVSVLTAVMLIPLVPKVIALPERMHLEEKNQQLEQEIAVRRALDAKIEAPLRSRVAMGFAVTILAAGLMGYMVWRGARRAASESDWVAHTQVVLTSLATTFGHMLDVETGARGFALVGQEQFLQPYNTGQKDLTHDLAELRRLTADNPQQQTRVTELEQRIAAAVLFTATMVAARRRTQSPPESAALFENKKRVDAVRATIQEMRKTEEKLLTQRVEARRAGREAASWMTTAGVLLGSLVLAGAGFLINREIGVSAGARAQITSLNASLEDRVEQRTAALNLEIAERKRVEDAVKESLIASEAALKELADQKFALDQHAIVAITDVQGTITYVNDKFCAISQYSKEELIGQNHRILNSGHHPKEFFQQMYHSIANGEVWHGEIRNRAKDGSIYWVDTTVVPFVRTDGKPRQYVAIRADITERKLAEARSVQLASIVESSADAIFSKDLSGIVLSWNQGAERMFGYSEAEAVGQPLKIVPPDRQAEIQEFNREIMQGRRMARDGTTRRCKDGTVLDVSIIMSPLRDPNGRIIGASVIARDISERKRAEVALKASLASSEVALKELADQKFALDQHAIVAITDVQGTITYVNDKFCAISQYSKDELLGQNHRILNSGHHPREFFQHMYHTIANGNVWHGEICNRAKDGSIYWVDTTVVPFVAADGKPRQYVAIRADITERKRAEEVRERLAAVVESSSDAIISKTLNGVITAWNPSAEKLFGYSPPEAIGQPMAMLFPQRCISQEQGILERITRGEHVDDYETVRIRKDGSSIDVAVTISPIKDREGKIIGASKIARDITQRKRSEVALKESLSASQAALKELADQKFALDQHAIVAITDVQGTITYVNDKFCAISQYSREELIGQNHRILNSGHHSRQFFQELYRDIAHGKVWHDEVCNRAKDGSIYWVDTTVVPFLDANGKPRQYLAIRADITERKRAADALEQNLTASETTLKELADQKFALDQHAIVAITDVQGTITYVNDKFCSISKYSKEELLGKNHRILNSGHHPKEFFQQMYRAIANGKVWHGEIKNRAKDRTFYWVDTTIVPFVNEEGKPRQYVAIRADITESKLAAEENRKLNEDLEQRVVERTTQLQIANKELEAFSYSVSHDLRAPLRHIIGFSKMLQEEFGTTLDPGASRYLDRIQVGTQKMGLLVDELLNLARVGRHPLNLQPVRLKATVEEVVAMLEPDTAGRQVEWVIDELPEVSCDPVLVKQVFQNLLANALKFTRPCAPPAAGKSQEGDTGGCSPVPHSLIHVGWREENGQLVLVVQDNGIGFNMKYVDKLFGVFQRLHRAEEFEGTGIGLATVQRIVHKHGGRVWAEGELGKGATFSFTLSAPQTTVAKNNAAKAGGQS